MDGLDIASFQKGIDLSVVPCDFVIIKATQGAGYVNPDFKRAYNQAVGAGKLVGVYHYASGYGVEAEANHFLDVAKECIGKAVLVLDWEGYQNNAFPSPSYAKAWLDYVYKKTGVRPLIYMSQSVTNEHNWSETAKSYGLWVAQYADNKADGYRSDPWSKKPYGAWGNTCAILQYTSVGRLKGYNGGLDLDKAYLSADEWKTLASGKNSVNTATIVSSAPTGSTLDLVYGVMSGKYGDGEDRKKRLGERYSEVQDLIDHIFTAPIATLVNETKAGKYGNGEIRKTVLGSRYSEVQDGINAGDAVYYVVNSGDTLSAIATKYGITYQAIAKLNGITDPNKIYAGQKIRVK